MERRRGTGTDRKRAKHAEISLAPRGAGAERGVAWHSNSERAKHRTVVVYLRHKSVRSR